MSKISINSPCPCGSRKKYKKCCAVYHKGALPKNALLLMESRYSAYALANSNYIIKTTHPNNSDYSINIEEWSRTIKQFTNSTEFLKLEVLEAVEFGDEAFVIFKAKLSSGDMLEKSRFLKVNNRWLYESGEIIISTVNSAHPTVL